MVSFKRKPVKIPPPDKTPVNENCPVWVIEQTLEYFTSYAAYLERMDFYNQRKFICELTGHSCLTYFEALEKEAREARAIVTDFPEPPKEPILQKVQFSRVSRLDLLVDEVYSAVRHDFFVGEILHARTRDQQRLRVTVHEVLPPLPGSTEKRYRCDHEFYPNRFDIYESSELFRDRKTFNKMSVRTFIKYAASRENWLGCPWIVRKEYTDIYPNIPTEPPEDIKLAAKARKTGFAQAPSSTDATANNRDDTVEVSATPEPTPRRRKQPFKYSSVLEFDKNVDDLDILAASTIDPSTYEKLKHWPHWQSEESIDEEMVGKALQIWSFINVYNEMLILSPISFDDFLKALNEEDSPVLAEIICSILTIYVDPDEDILAVPFPSQYEPKASKRTSSKRAKIENGDADDSSAAPEEIAATTAEDEEEEEDDDSMDSDTSNGLHNADEYINMGSDWMERIGKREYTNGGWQSLVICTLSESSYMREWLPIIQDLLVVLADPNTKPSLATAKSNWKKLSSKLKIEALNILVQILHTAPALRQFMEQRSEQSTKIRKERAEVSREQRTMLETVKSIRDKRATNPDDTEVRKELEKAVTTQEELAEKVTALSNELLHYDCTRLRLLGKDRFYNRYWWFEANGVERLPLKQDDKPFFLMSRIWVQGPTKEDFEKRLNNFAINIRITDRRDRASEVAWQEKCKVITQQREAREVAKRFSAQRKPHPIEMKEKPTSESQVFAKQPPKGGNIMPPALMEVRRQPIQPGAQQQPQIVQPVQPQASQQPQQPQQLQQPQFAQHPQMPGQPPFPQMPQMMQMQMQGPRMQYMSPNGAPVYYSQPMYPVPQNQYMMPMPMQQYPQVMGQQVVYMMPQNINGVQTFVPVQVPQHFNQQFPGQPMQMPMQYPGGQMPGQFHQMQMQMPGQPQMFPQMQQLPQIQQQGPAAVQPAQQQPGAQTTPQPQQPTPQSGAATPQPQQPAAQAQPAPPVQPIQPPVQPVQPASDSTPDAGVKDATDKPSESASTPAEVPKSIEPVAAAPAPASEKTSVVAASATQPTEASNDQAVKDAAAKLVAPVAAPKEIQHSPSVSPKTAVPTPVPSAATVTETPAAAPAPEAPAVENGSTAASSTVGNSKESPDEDAMEVDHESTEVNAAEAKAAEVNGKVDKEGDVEMEDADDEKTAEPEPVPEPTPAAAGTKSSDYQFVEIAASFPKKQPEQVPTPKESEKPQEAPIATKPEPDSTTAPTKSTEQSKSEEVKSEQSTTTVASDAKPTDSAKSTTATSTEAKPTEDTKAKPTEAKNESDTEDENIELPPKEKFQPLTALGLKKTVEGSLILTKPDEWRFYDNEEELNQLQIYLVRNSLREGELLDKLVKLDTTIRACFKARETALEQGTKEWTNELAKEKLGHIHSGPKGRKRGKR